MQKQNTFEMRNNKQGFLSNDPKKAMQEMMDTIDQMRGVYLEETDALERMDAKAFLSLQDQKLQATDTYRLAIEDILARKKEMRTVDPAMKQELARMQRDFSDLSGRNLTALKRMQKTMVRLGETIQTAAKDSINKDRAVSYGESGRLESNEAKRVSIGVSETA